MSFSLKRYLKNDAGPDVLSGLTVAAVLIPQALAYAVLAGLPPSYGLYAAFVPGLIYPIFGRVHYLSVGPTALMSILVYSGVQGINPPDASSFISLCMSVSLLSGIFQMLMGALRLGFVVRFISKPVLNGFISAAALIILSSQLKYFFGLRIERASGFFGKLIAFSEALFASIQSPQVFHIIWVSSLGVLSIVLMRWLKKKFMYFPTALILVIGSILFFMQFPEYGEEFLLLGNVELNIPSLAWPEFSVDVLTKIIPVSLSVAIISFIESYAISKGLAEDGMKLAPNRELISLGFSKVVGSFFQAFPTTGSFSRSAISKSSGARTGMSSVLTSVVVFGGILFAGNTLSFVPYFLLAAIIISAVLKLIDLRTPLALLRQHKKDFYGLVITFLATLLFGVQWGLLIGISFSVLLLMMYHSKPLFSILHRQENGKYRDSLRFPNSEFHPEDTLVYRFDQDLLFWNASYFLTKSKEAIDAAPHLKKVVLDARAMVTMDSTGADAMRQLIEFCKQKNLLFIVVGLKGKIRDDFEIFGLDQLMEQDDFLLYSLEEAVP